MSMLNIKKFPDALYRKLQARARARHRSVAQEAISIISDAIDQPEPRSLLELKGLGKATWADVDPDEHIRRERDSWD
jgi:plasmid stability protein